MWSSATRVSTIAWDAFTDVQNMIADIGDITETDPDNSNGLFGKIMSVSVVAHDAHSD